MKLSFLQRRAPVNTCSPTCAYSFCVSCNRDFDARAALNAHAKKSHEDTYHPSMNVTVASETRNSAKIEALDS